MIKKIKFVPHVPGEIGEQSVIDFSSERFKVEHLHMIFDFIPDDFCTSFPVYFISQELLNEFELENISGFKDPVLISHE